MLRFDSACGRPQQGCMYDDAPEMTEINESAISCRQQRLFEWPAMSSSASIIGGGFWRDVSHFWEVELIVGSKLCLSGRGLLYIGYAIQGDKMEPFCTFVVHRIHFRLRMGVSSQIRWWRGIGAIKQRCRPSTWYLYATCTCTCHLELQVLIQVHREDWGRVRT